MLNANKAVVFDPLGNAIVDTLNQDARGEQELLLAWRNRGTSWGRRRQLCSPSQAQVPPVIASTHKQPSLLREGP
jgi:hypothetical protein